MQSDAEILTLVDQDLNSNGIGKRSFLIVNPIIMPASIIVNAVDDTVTFQINGANFHFASNAGGNPGQHHYVPVSAAGNGEAAIAGINTLRVRSTNDQNQLNEDRGDHPWTLDFTLTSGDGRHFRWRYHGNNSPDVSADLRIIFKSPASGYLKEI